MDISRYFCLKFRKITKSNFHCMPNQEIIKTEDGSDTIYNQDIGESYHSRFGALQESMHVFITAGLRQIKYSSVNILEIGFGTGLNALLSLAESMRSGQTMQYITIEKFPLPRKIWNQLNYTHILPDIEPHLFNSLHDAEWNMQTQITDNFSILKLSCDLLEIDYSTFAPVDLVYFDAFSPEKQPELWETSVIKKITSCCAQGSKFVTYCAKGAVRRSLIEAGYTTERIAGPPGKREMLRGTKNSRKEV